MDKKKDNIRMLKPTFIVPIMSTIIFLTSLFVMAETQVHRDELYVVGSMISGLCSLLLWRSYVISYKNYKEACNKEHDNENLKRNEIE